MVEGVAWEFREILPGEVITDPVQREFFAPQAMAESLVRESVQNSLDARSQCNKEVRMRFAFSGKQRAVSVDSAQRYLIGLRPHIFPVLGQRIERFLAKPMKFIVIEDFGTRGLCGDPAQSFDVQGQSRRNDFFYFWRNVARSKKGGAERGRWGVGKTVFPASSQIGAFFGLTVREDDKQPMLMGQAVLKTHLFGKKVFAPYGYYARFQGPMPLPIQNRDSIDTFRLVFGLKRQSEPGFSIVIPYPMEEDIRMDTIQTEFIRQYFYPVLGGELTIELDITE